MEVEVKLVYRLVIGDEQKELTEQQAMSLRNSLLSLFPIQGPEMPGKSRIIPRPREVKKTGTGGWSYGNLSVSDKCYRATLNALDEQEFRDLGCLAERTKITDETVRKALAVLIAQGKALREREGIKLVYKLKTVSYSPVDKTEKIGTIPQNIDLSALQRDKELRRDLAREQ